MFFHSSSKTAANEAVVNQPLYTMENLSTSSVQPSKQQEPVNPAKTDTLSSVPKPAEPREHRRPNRPGIVWAAGSRLQARDFLNKWYD